MRKTRKNRKRHTRRVRSIRSVRNKYRRGGGTEVVVVNGQTMSKNQFNQLMEQRDRQGPRD